MDNILFRNEPFMARVFGKGDALIQCVPVVYNAELSCGVGILLPDDTLCKWGLHCPRDLIAAWRATEILRQLDTIEPETLCAAYYAGKRQPGKEDMDRLVKPITAKIGEWTRYTILAMPVPEKIIRAILDNQNNEKLKPALWPIIDEVSEGAIGWRQEFSDAGLEHPDQTEAKERARKHKIAKFEPLLASFAKFRCRPRDCIAMDDVEKILLDLVKKGANETHSDRVIIALAGAAGNFIGLSDLTDKDCLTYRNREAISKSAQWLVSGWINPRLSLFFWRSEGKAGLLSAIEEFLRQMSKEYFSSKPASAKVFA